MRKTLFAIAVATAAFCHGQETAAPAPPAQQQPAAPVREVKAPWPVWVQLNSTDNMDVVGLRFTIPYGKCDEVTGLDLGFFSHTRNMYGVQVNILRSDASDTLAGVQAGIWNSAGRADMVSVQAGLWNEAGNITGAQIGGINVAGGVEGFQVGLINRAETLHGYQIGAINIIRSAAVQFMTIVNVGF